MSTESIPTAATTATTATMKADANAAAKAAARAAATTGVKTGTATAAGRITKGDHLIEARDVHLSFGETPALQGADLSVAQGEIVAIMGPSGSGKSTLLHCLAGILIPDSGEIRFDGRAVHAMRETERSALRRDNFGFVFQFGQLVPELTAEENVALPLLLAKTKRGTALKEARDWFPRLGLDGVGGRRSGELSGGQAQRVAIARAMISKPDILFADEPTGSLDSLTGENVMNLMVDMAREQGTTVILVTHEPRVAAYADREVVVRDGKVTSYTGAGAA